MKKIFLLGIFLFISFMCFGFKDVKAKTLDGFVDFGDTSQFNIFYELNHQTKLANFLVMHGINLLDYLKGLSGLTESVNTVGIRYFEQNGKRKIVLFLYELYNIKLTPTEKILSTGYNSIYLFFDEDMNYEDSLKVPISERQYSVGSSDVNDVTSLFSYIYFTTSRATITQSGSNNAYDMISFRSVKTDGTHQKMEDLNWWDWFKRITAWTSFVGANNIFYSQYDFKNNLDLTYYKENPIVSINHEFKGLGNVLFDKTEAINPPGFTSINLSVYLDVYLTPKSSCGSECDYNLYFYSSYGEVPLYTTSYLLGTKLKKNKDIYYNAERAFTTSMIDITKAHEIENIFNYTFQVHSGIKKYEIVLFYDSDSWNVTKIASTSDSYKLLGPDGTEYTLSPTDVYLNHNNSQAGNDDKYHDNEPGNPKPGTDAGFNFDLGTITSSFKSFVNSISAVGSMSTAFLDSLPSEVKTALLTVFTIGCVGIIIKILL